MAWGGFIDVAHIARVSDGEESRLSAPRAADHTVYSSDPLVDCESSLCDCEAKSTYSRAKKMVRPNELVVVESMMLE